MFTKRRYAKAAGHKFYNTGKPCIRGHRSDRSTASGACLECRSEDYHKWYANNSDYALSRARKWRAANPDRRKKTNSDWYQRNRKRCLAGHKHWRRANPEKVAKIKRKSGAKRRAGKLKATPKWADLELIGLVYDACPDGHQVDHIIPLRGELACGLHVAENLQYLPARLNAAKGNSVPSDPDYRPRTGGRHGARKQDRLE